MSDPASSTHAPKRSQWSRPFPVVLEIPVAWGEMDAFQHLNNAVYFRYAESTRIAYFQRVGLAQAMTRGVGPILAETRCRFKAPVTFPDTVAAGVRVTSLGEDRFEMLYSLWSHKLEREAAAIWATIVTYNYGEGRKAPVPPEVAQAIRELELAQGNPEPALLS